MTVTMAVYSTLAELLPAGVGVDVDRQRLDGVGVEPVAPGGHDAAVAVPDLVLDRRAVRP